jgi:hypothetical protein
VDRLTLLPCPFCGNADIDKQFAAFQKIGDDDSKTLYDPGCMKCGASAPADVWNRRQSLSQEAKLEGLLRDALVEFKDDARGAPVCGPTRIGLMERIECALKREPNAAGGASDE